MGFRGLVAALLIVGALPVNAAEAAAKVDCARVKCLALTFDDGPGPYTAALLSHLRKEKAKATFFLMGKRVPERPAVIRRMAKEGHEIGAHTFSHPYLSTLPDEEITRELESARDAVAEVTGKEPATFRPPYGDTDDRVLELAGASGLAQVMWTGTTLDWSLRDEKKIKAAVLRLARRDGVILMHDVVPQTVRAMPGILRELKKRGYHLVTVSALLKGRRLGAGESYP